MKKAMSLMLVIFALAAAGCSGKFWAGAGGGALGSAAAYELHANKELNRIEEDLRDNRINQQEYEIRKDQIKRMSVYQTLKKDS